MKYALSFIIAAALIFTACKKKSTPTHCYVCVQYDSFFVVSRGGWEIYPNGIIDTLCDKNQALINMYEESHIPNDTFNLHSDSLGYGYTYFRCALAN